MNTQVFALAMVLIVVVAAVLVALFWIRHNKEELDKNKSVKIEKEEVKKDN